MLPWESLNQDDGALTPAAIFIIDSQWAQTKANLKPQRFLIEQLQREGPNEGRSKACLYSGHILADLVKAKSKDRNVALTKEEKEICETDQF